MARRALVLGGGGPVGIAWESGIVAGLEHEGVAAGGADLIVGTSAGSVVGAQLALGRSGEELLAAQIAEASRAGSQPSADAAPAPDLGPLIQMMMNRPAEGELPVPKRVEIGAFALRAKTIGEETFIANFGRVAEARGAFPERFVCTAIDAVDGSFATWNKAAGVESAGRLRRVAPCPESSRRSRSKAGATTTAASALPPTRISPGATTSYWWWL